MPYRSNSRSYRSDRPMDGSDNYSYRDPQVRSGSEYQSSPADTHTASTRDHDGRDRHSRYATSESPGRRAVPLSEDDPVDRLTDRLQNMTVGSPDSRAPHRSPTPLSVTRGLSQICYRRCTDVPHEVGCFVDHWTPQGHSAPTILNKLAENNIILPHEYVFHRLGHKTVITYYNGRDPLSGRRVQ